MVVELKTSLAGARFSLAPGEFVEFTDAEAKRLIAKGYAVEHVPDEQNAESPEKAKTKAKK